MRANIAAGGIVTWILKKWGRGRGSGVSEHVVQVGK
jgi:hypothetical protein